MIRDHPVLGVGLDNFLYLYRDRYVARDAVQERFLNHPHNALLDWWTRLGLPGIAVFAALVAGNLRLALRTLGRGRADLAPAAAATGMQLYALAHGLLDNHFFLVDLAVAWWLAQALLLALADENERAPAREGRGLA
jgi:O-antigen ligase